MKTLIQKRYSGWQVVAMLAVAFLGMAVLSYAAVTIPNTFSAGDTISSSQVNDNFTALATAMPAANIKYASLVVSVTSTAFPGMTIVSAQVTPPADGYVVVTGNGYIQFDVVGTQAIIFLSITAPVDTTKAITHYTPLSSGQQYRSSFSIMDIFPVTKNVPVTVLLNGYGSQTFGVYAGRIAALFVPASLSMQ